MEALRFSSRFLIMTSLAYLMLVNKTLQLYNCSLQADGNYYLDSSPGDRCYTSLWYSYVPMAVSSSRYTVLHDQVVGIILWLIGVPLGIFTVLIKFRKHLDKADIKMLFGFFFVNYKRDYYWWLSVETGKKLLLVMSFLIRDTTYLIM